MSDHSQHEVVQVVHVAPVKPPNGIATAGFVLSFFTLIPFFGIAIFVLSVVFCGVGWRRANVEGRQGKGLAIAGIVINTILLIFTMMFIVAILNAAA